MNIHNLLMPIFDPDLIVSIKQNQTESNRIKQDQTESNRIKPDPCLSRVDEGGPSSNQFNHVSKLSKPNLAKHSRVPSPFQN